MSENMGNYAVLIDAENVSGDYVEDIINKASDGRSLIIKRIFGNWTNNVNGKWKEPLLKYSISPVQQFSNSVGKNSSDSALIINAMDLLYTHEHLEGFIIVSSDGDYTGLATRLKESGKIVIGIGKKCTPESFINACTKFLFLEEPPKVKRGSSSSKNTNAGQGELTLEMVKEYADLVIERRHDDDGRVIVSVINEELENRFKQFSYHDFGHSTITKMLKAMGYRIEEHPGSNNYVIWNKS